MTGADISLLTTSVARRRSARRLARRKKTVVLAALIALIVIFAFLSLTLGKASVSVSEVFATMIGQGTAMTELVVLELRLPRILTAIVVGACLGMSGSVFQSTLRNPLASPDIIGITASASVVGVVCIVSFGMSGYVLTLTVIVGTLLAAVLMYVLAWREGLNAFRLVLVGIGVGAFCAGFVSFILSRSDIRDAQTALVWVTGSLSGSSWQALWPMTACAVIIVGLVAMLSRPARILALGDDTAAGLGIPVEKIRLATLGCAVALAAIAVSTVGPLAFVALAAGQISRRLLRSGSSSVATAACVGGALLLGADIIAQHALPSTPLPTGVVTGLVGAPFLIWLLVRASRTGNESGQ
ncbi:iron complex transport system permease protein [Microbacterium halimionae]|uniref:Iron complex transport system permease protein n=1 Tax=Microbacterium halimionae TaxID=1526413 RepID=A0A7W3PMB4_9MICO|nr:iron chelate uptake ABC transporter family permease subunit [Microbacterium halimionae]MBA8816807.1 iron complex transport system permease protein [Microbacterium halimionae]NII94897.1 iron complex transport system permease protein [Microbacterium halimionae]